MKHVEDFPVQIFFFSNNRFGYLKYPIPTRQNQNSYVPGYILVVSEGRPDTTNLHPFPPLNCGHPKKNSFPVHRNILHLAVLGLHQRGLWQIPF